MQEWDRRTVVEQKILQVVRSQRRLLIERLPEAGKGRGKSPQQGHGSVTPPQLLRRCDRVRPRNQLHLTDSPLRFERERFGQPHHDLVVLGLSHEAGSDSSLVDRQRRGGERAPAQKRVRMSTKACIGRVGESCKGKARPRSASTRPLPRQQLQKCSGARPPVQRSLDVRAEQPPLPRRIGQASIRQSLDLDERERPERIPVVVEHCARMELEGGGRRKWGGGASFWSRRACLCARLQPFSFLKPRGPHLDSN